MEAMQISMSQLRLRLLSIFLLPLLVASVSKAGQRFLQEDTQAPEVKYVKYPGVPSEEMAAGINIAANTAEDWAKNEEASSALHAAAADNAEAAAKAELITEYHGMRLKTATLEAVTAAQKAAEMRKRAAASVKRSEALVAEMPAIAMKAAARATDSVIQGAIYRMDQEATLVAEEQAKLERKLQGEAAKAAQEAALPWQQAKLRSQETMVSYVSQARELATAVTHLKNMAPELSKQAGVLQSRGDVVRAQEHQIAAKDILDKAKQLEGQAISFDKMANKINANIGMYDLSASSAASYAAYTTNPGGGVGRSSLPDLPYPLKLLSPSGAPGPAPAPAAAN